MTFQRGDIVIVSFPFSSGTGTKRRPALVVQNDVNNQRLTNIIVAAITTTTHRSHQPTQLLVEVQSAVGRQSGLLLDSVVTCENLATIETALIVRRIGSLPQIAMQAVNDCLKSALGLT